MNTRVLTKPSLLKWRQFIQKQESVSFYHLGQWFKIAKESLDLQPKILIAEEKGKIVGALPLFWRKGLVSGRRLITLPFGEADFLGLDKIKRTLINEAAKLAREWQANLEIFSTQKISGLPLEYYQNLGHAYYLLSVRESYENIWQTKFHKKTRNMVRKAEKVGIEIEDGDESDLDNFYRLYLKTMRKLGLIPLPLQVFKLTWCYFANESSLLKAVYQTKILGYLWVFIWGGTLWIWANATEEQYLPLGTNYALYNQAIKMACKNRGIKQINFGGSDLDSPQEFFKLRWGSSPHLVYLISNNPQRTEERWQLQKAIKSIVKRLPLPILKLCSNLAYKVY